LYERARKWLEASHCYERVDNFGRAVKILDKEELYDQAIDCLQRYNIRRQVSQSPFNSCCNFTVYLNDVSPHRKKIKN
jgi:hypothetical protein